jgi:hypothetical protein
LHNTVPEKLSQHHDKPQVPPVVAKGKKSAAKSAEKPEKKQHVFKGKNPFMMFKDTQFKQI